MHKTPLVIIKHGCPCGARRNKSSRLCRKCSVRARWYRRRAWRSSKKSVRYRTGKK